MLNVSNDVTREVNSTYEEWLKYPVKVTADQCDIEHFIDIDNPGLPVRDYRFLPKLKIVTPREIMNGYRPTRLDRHYSGMMRAMADGQHRAKELYHRTNRDWDILAIDRITSRFDNSNSMLTLTRDVCRWTFIRAIEIEVLRPPNRYDHWEGDPDTYMFWLVQLLDHIDVRASSYRDSRLKEFCELTLLLTAFCARRCGSDVMIMSEEEATDMLCRLKRLDRMLTLNIQLGVPAVVPAKSSTTPMKSNKGEDQIMKRTETKSKSCCRRIFVDSFGNFHRVPEEVEEIRPEEVISEEETQPVETDNNAVSLNELARRNQVFRTNDNGEYVATLVNPKEYHEKPYIDGLEAFEAVPKQNVVLLGPDNPAMNFRVDRDTSINLNVSVNNNVPQFSARIDGDDYEEDYDEEDEDDNNESYYDEGYDEEDDEESDEILIDELLAEHARLMSKLNLTDPRKWKKNNELNVKLDWLERSLGDMTKGMPRYYSYKRRTWGWRLLRTVKWSAKHLWEMIMDNIEPIAVVGGIILTVLGVGKNVAGTVTPTPTT